MTEISDDIEVVGPGRMLKEARELRGLSQQQVADKLNLRKTLVQEIELEQFDLTLPEAFNRGYLKNYAHLVNISQEDVLNSYDQLGVAQRQYAEMQSFSKGTEKQAEHKMLMWITYLILAVLITATVVWWLQRPSVQPEPIVMDTVATNIVIVTNGQQQGANKTSVQHDVNNDSNPELTSTKTGEVNQDNVNAVSQVTKNVTESLDDADGNSLTSNDKVTENSPNEANTSEALALSNQKNLDGAELTKSIVDVVFTFSGDCWVNISDATGERIAWGVKKSGYVMSISGQAPFSITLGRPELVQINYNDVPVDMSVFNAGNIAKFSLPLVP